MLSMMNSRLSGLNPASNLCNQCRIKPRYVDGMTVHPYCGIGCAALAQNSTEAAQNNRPSGSRSVSLGPTCETPECSSPAFVDHTTGIAGKFCSKRHRWLGRNGCISCRKAPPNGSVVFCQTCYNRILRSAPLIFEVPADHARYDSVESQFTKKWLHGSTCPEVRAIYKIVSTTANVTTFQQYLEKVEAKGNFSTQGRARGNENRRWHGTVRKCNLGDEGETELCAYPSCSLCGIIKTSFDISYSVRSRTFKRFGVGIYTSSTSSKASDYSRNGSRSNNKAILLNKVVAGRGYKMTVDKITMTEPPAGFDSVIGEVGGALNYDELVVYNDDAILPSYLVVYDDGPK